MLIASVSYGNDSVALLQWLHEHGYATRDRVLCVYADTGWASHEWPARVERAEAWARSIGVEPHRVARPGGLVALSRLKRAWPRHGMQFCTEDLKVRTITDFLSTVDPEAEATVCIGVRREESERRSQWPEHVPDSPKHGGRDAWFPLVTMREPDRNALVERAGFEVLPYRSRECHPCVNANKVDIRSLSEARIAEIEQLEAAMGVGVESGAPKTFFRPAAHGGAVGIRAVARWARSERGRFSDAQGELWACDSGFCGS